MKLVVPILVVLLIFVGLFLIGKVAIKPTFPHQCIPMCGNGKCDNVPMCVAAPCACPEYPTTCSIDC